MPDIEETIEARINCYLENYKLVQTQKKIATQLKALAAIGDIIQPYLNNLKEMKAIRKIISLKGHAAYIIWRIVKWMAALIQARGPDTYRDY